MIDNDADTNVDASASAIIWNRVPATTYARNAVDFLMRELEEGEDRKRARRKTDRARMATTLGALALELYVAHRSPGNSFRRYSRAKTEYEKRDRYHRSPVSYTSVTTAADWLLAEGYAEGRLGYYQRFPEFGKDAGAGEQSRIGASRKLVSLLEDDFELTIHHVGFAPWLETVILRKAAEERGGIKSDIEYEDTGETHAMRANLQRINEKLADFRITLQAPDESLADLPPFRLRRIFSRSSFKLGGRFYGGPWMDMPSEQRPHLLIDGEETVELDFSSLHPRLIYQIEGKPLPAEQDAYAVPEWTGKEWRGWVKTAFQQLLNAEPGMRLCKPREMVADELANGGWKRLLRDTKRAHSEIDGWFWSGRGLELQRIDSDIAEAVLLSMLGQGICCLSIHDSFIVPRSHEHDLRNAMQQGYHEVLARRGYPRHTPIIHARRSPSSFTN